MTAAPPLDSELEFECEEEIPESEWRVKAGGEAWEDTAEEHA